MVLSSWARVAFTALLLTSVASATPAPASRETGQPPAIALVPCPLPRSSDTMLCGNLTVFEDRAAQAGRRITLNIAILPALGPARRPDPVFILSGGPGLGAASSVTGFTAKAMAKFRRERDIVFVDQRGTGKSHPFGCRFSDGAGPQGQFNDLFPPAGIRACRERLEKTADLRLYTTPIAMDDLDEVRAALGYDRINLYGISYGSLAALQYLRQHPTRLRSVILAGVATPAGKQPLHLARAAQQAMDALIEDCAADATCALAFPQLKRDFETVLAMFDKGPVTFELSNPTSKATESMRMSRAVFVERLRLMLYTVESAARVPLVIHRAARGNWGPFAASSPTGAIPGVSGMYLTITCSENAAVITEEDIVRESRDTFVGEDRTRLHLRACQEWPRAGIPPSFYEPVISDTAVLILSGELDAATPPSLATAAARTLPNSRQILMRNEAHGYWNDCTQDLMAEFVTKASARDLDVSCVQTLRRPPFVTEITTSGP